MINTLYYYLLNHKNVFVSHSIDFGLSKHYVPGDVQHDAVGTPYTCSPEVIAGNYDSKCDMWAIGVLSFMLLCGDTPFGG